MLAGANRSLGNIVVVDDDPAVRRLTARLLEREGYAVRCFEDGEALLAAGVPRDADSIILDLCMPGRSGLQILRALQETGEPVRVIMVTGRGEIATAVEAMKLGAADFIEKPFKPEDLLTAVERSGRHHAQPAIAPAARRDAESKIAALTARQRDVLLGVVWGESNKQIAHRLGLSVRTVEAYRAQLMQRIGARCTAEAVRFALLAGLGRPEQAYGRNTLV